jgi:predicted DNA-binding transcriptional regulator AlpA
MTEETQTTLASNSQSLLIGAKELATLLGISRSLLYGLHSSGRLGPLPYELGGRVLWSRKEIEEWVDSGLPPRVKWVAIRKMQSEKEFQR